MYTVAKNQFIELFKKEPSYYYKAPARINLIGEHIDYNGGNVFPAAINRYIYACVDKRIDKQIHLKTSFDDREVIYNLDNLEFTPEMDWEAYPLGVIYILQKHGYDINHGLNITFDSEIPMASGLSSSAAMLDLMVYLVSDIFSLGLSREQITLFAKEVENDYCHLKSGIMDQAIIALGKANNALLLDCNKFKYSYVPVDLGEYEFVVLQSNKPRQLIESKYNERVDECQSALKAIKKEYNVNTLCELHVEDLPRIKELLNDELLFKRVRHVVKENARVNDFINALKNKDILTLGNLLKESHISLQEDYEVTGLHLDALYYASMSSKAIGARMTGAGFGGCAIALIKKSDYQFFKKSVEEKYLKATGISPTIYEIEIVDGVNKD